MTRRSSWGGICCWDSARVPAGAATRRAGTRSSSKKTSRTDRGEVVKYLETEAQGKDVRLCEIARDVRKDVGAYHRVVCFVCPPTENFPGLRVGGQQVLPHARRRPVVDAIWGILTGSTRTTPGVGEGRAGGHSAGVHEDARPVAELGGGRGLRHEWTRDKGEIGTKAPARISPSSPAGRRATRRREVRPQDAVRGQVRPDHRSGQGGARNWMTMYPADKVSDGQERQNDHDGPGRRTPLAASRPKVYWAAGIASPVSSTSGKNNFKDSYALTWMKNGPAVTSGRFSPRGTSSTGTWPTGS